MTTQEINKEKKQNGISTGNAAAGWFCNIKRCDGINMITF